MGIDNLVSVSELYYSRENKSIFQGVNMTIPRGKITAIMGPSGCGKTTLLKLITAGLYPDTGKVLLDGENIHSLSRGDLYQARQKIGLLFQSGALFTDLTVYDNVAFPLREHTSLSESLIRDIVLMKLEAVGLRGARDLMPSSLSGGMARRVALARAIALDPELMLYDEPFTGQDPISMGMLVRLIKNLNELLGLTTVIVSHDVSETLAIADEVYLLSQGKVVAHGAPSILLESDNAHVKQFVQGLSDGVVPFHYPARAYEEELMNAD
jgi:phospholipid/cholesterol/gamma-HCH transport system ATP-binding protein